MKLPFFLSVALHAAVFAGLYAHRSAFTVFGISGAILEIVVSPAGPGALARSGSAKRVLPRESVAPADPPTSAPMSAVVTAPATAPVTASATAFVPASAPAGAAPGASSASESENAIASAFSRNRAPEYPRISRLRGEEGRVVIAVLIAKDGARIAPARAKLSSGFENLDRAAVAAVESWSFSPLERGERLDLEIPFVFRLEEKR